MTDDEKKILTAYNSGTKGLIIEKIHNRILFVATAFIPV
jgi:hypothetical protein